MTSLFDPAIEHTWFAIHIVQWSRHTFISLISYEEVVFRKMPDSPNMLPQSSSEKLRTSTPSDIERQATKWNVEVFRSSADDSEDQVAL